MRLQVQLTFMMETNVNSLRAMPNTTSPEGLVGKSTGCISQSEQSRVSTKIKNKLPNYL